MSGEELERLLLPDTQIGKDPQPQTVFQPGALRASQGHAVALSSNSPPVLQTSHAAPPRLDPPAASWHNPEDFAYEEGWMKQIAAIIKAVFLLSIVTSVVVALISHRDIEKKFPLIFWYIICTIIGDLAAYSVTLCCITCITASFGLSSAPYAAPMLGIFTRVLSGLIAYASSGCGIYIFTMYWAEFEDWHKWGAIAVYIAVETWLSFYAVLWTLPTLWGVVKYAAHKVSHKLKGAPVVTFYTEYQAPFFAMSQGLEAYKQSLVRLQNRMFGYTPVLSPGEQDSSQIEVI